MQSKSEKSHINLIKTFKSEIDSITDNDVVNLLRSLKTKKNNKLSDNYKISILRTLKSVNSNITKTPKSLKLKCTRTNKTININRRKIIIDIIKVVYGLTTGVIQTTESRSLIDTYIAILLITSCQIRVDDIFKLTLNDLNELVTNQKIRKSKVILINRLFVNAELLIRELINQRNKIITDQMINVNMLITCSHNIINKTIKNLCEEAALNSEIHNDEMFKSMGISKFRFKEPSFLYQFLGI